MSPDGELILSCLAQVAAERAARAAEAGLAERSLAVKDFQHRRFEGTYADLAAQTRYAAAVRFFLEELYGPSDFTQRDEQFRRIVPALVRLFPAEIVRTVRLLGELHALSEQLDSQLARHLPSLPIDDAVYRTAWQAVGRPAERARQIHLLLDVGRALDRYTRNPLLRHSLRVMRMPANAAGLGDLQRFLEAGFDTFRNLKGADDFLGIVESRERALVAHWFAPAS